MFKNKSGWLLGVVTLASALAGCSTGSSTTDAATQDITTMVAQSVETSSDSTDAAEVASLMKGLHAVRSEAVEGFHCDASPDVTSITVCGKSLPATVHLEWTDCAAPGRPGDGGGHGGDKGGGKGGDCDGGGHGGTPPAEGTPSPTATAPTSGTTAATAAKSGPGKGPRFGPSSGKVNIAYTYAAAEDCSGSVTQDQSVTFEISRTDEDGAISAVKGTSASSALLTGDAPPQKKATQADLTRTLTDASGTVVSSVHLKGSTSTDFSADSPPVRTVNGAYTEDFLDGTTGTVTLASIVRPPRDTCAWPTSGTLTRATSAEDSHTLSFGPDCGAATLDGTAVDLTTYRLPGGKGGKGGH